MFSTEHFKLKRNLTPFQIIIIGFAAVIFIGALILMLPISSKSGEVTPFNVSIFTSASAVCVTGLVLRDTASYWSYFGQAVILVLIQIGGLGVVTVAAALSLLSGRRISLSQRSAMQESISAPKLGGIVKLTGFILKGTAIFEIAGAVALMPAFIKDYGLSGIWKSFFHSISAFCNAGFDIMGTEDAQFPSLTSSVGNPLVNIVIMLLITVGGIGFLTWNDIKTNRFHLRRYRLQSKIILLTSALLVIIPAVYFFIFEFSSYAPAKRALISLFQAVTPRTAGFNTVNLNEMSASGKTVMIMLMLIGGSPGSTAGGMKTTTIAVLALNAAAVFKRRENAGVFGRRIDDNTVKNAATILIMYLSLFIFGAIVISQIEGIPLDVCLFETASAIGTVGLSLGVTPSLGIVSQAILIILMFFGRVGGLTLIYAALSGTNMKFSKLPQEKVTVG